MEKGTVPKNNKAVEMGNVKKKVGRVRKVRKREK